MLKASNLSNYMESFRINTNLNGNAREILVIPDDCTDMSIFHLVVDGAEFCKLRYSESKYWELVEKANISPEEVQDLGRKIEAYYN